LGSREHVDRAKQVELILYSRPGCHLCEEMKEVVARVVREIGGGVREVDISADPDLEAVYREQIPVLFVNGRKAFKFRVSEEALRKRLRSG
jgi:glutaredoxin